MNKGILVATCVAALTPVAAIAQLEILPNAANASWPVAPVEYSSAFEGYQSTNIHELKSWTKLNEQMRHLGGHAGHLEVAPRVHGTHPPPGGAEPSVSQRKPESADTEHEMK